MNIRIRKILPKDINYNEDIWKCRINERNVAISFLDTNENVKTIFKNYTLIKLKTDKESLNWVNDRHLKDFLNYVSTKNEKSIYKITLKNSREYIEHLMNKGYSIIELSHIFLKIEEFGKTFNLIDFEIFNSNQVYNMEDYFKKKTLTK